MDAEIIVMCLIVRLLFQNRLGRPAKGRERTKLYPLKHRDKNRMSPGYRLDALLFRWWRPLGFLSGVVSSDALP
jgi:hypothetical protein